MKMPDKFTKTLTSVALLASLALAGCSTGSTDASSSVSADPSSTESSDAATPVADEPGAVPASVISYDTHYDADDLTWDRAGEVTVNLSNPTATDGVTVANGVITITGAGDYRLSGTLADGQVVVAAGEEDVVRLMDGAVMISAGDDAFKAERELEIAGGSLTIENSLEAIEGQYITISGGTIQATSSDDGINATIPTGGDVDVAVDAGLTITGGQLTLNVEGDGIDSNGTAEISGGTVVINGPTIGGNSAVDAAGGLIVSGGTLIQSDAGELFEGLQGAYARFSAYISPGNTVTVTNSAGVVVAEYISTKAVSTVVVAGSGITEGEVYTISVNGIGAGTVTATSGLLAAGGAAPGGQG